MHNAIRRVSTDRVETRPSFWRSLQTFNITRVVVAAVLMIYINFHSTGIEVARQFLYPDTDLFYLVAAIALAISGWYHRSHFMLQLLTQVVLDLAIISLLYIASGGARGGLAILYLLPLAGLAILARLLLALFFVSLVSIFLLLEDFRFIRKHRLNLWI